MATLSLIQDLIQDQALPLVLRSLVSFNLEVPQSSLSLCRMTLAFLKRTDNLGLSDVFFIYLFLNNNLLLKSITYVTLFSPH